MALGPIRPREVKDPTIIPEAIYQAINHLIMSQWNGEHARITPALLRLYCRDNVPEPYSFSIVPNDIEVAYRAVGWQVEWNISAQQFWFRKQ